MADYAKIDNAMKNALHAIEHIAIRKNTPKSVMANYKLGYLSSMMVGFLSQQSDETRQAFFDAVDFMVMNNTLVEDMTKHVDITAEPHVMS